MRFSLTTAAAAVVGLATLTDARLSSKRAQPSAAPTDVQILNYALTLEYLERDFYAAGLAKFDQAAFTKAGFGGDTYQRIKLIGAQEATHVSFLSTALGTSATTECKYNFPLATVAQFLQTALVLEGVGTSAYLGAAGDITEKAYLAAAGSILTVEARHSSFLLEVNGLSGFPGPYDAPLLYSEVYTLASAFIVPGSCTGTAPLPRGIHAYNTLTIKTAKPKAGSNLGLHFAYPAGTQTFFAAFINGGATTFVAINPKNGVVAVPATLTGTTYVVVANSNAALSDDNILAGPAVLLL